MSAPSGASPPPVTDLHAISSAAGLQLAWTAATPPLSAAVMLRRTVEPVGSSSAKALPQGTPTGSKFGRKFQPQGVPIHLLAAAPGHDRGGTVDATAERERIYQYVAWRERSVTIDGSTFILRSDDSPALLAAFHDVAAPRAPAELQAVADGDSVDLSWEPNTEPDLAGYLVERDVASDSTRQTCGLSQESAWLRLSADPLGVPGFRDTPPHGLATARYRILAIDRSGNISPASAAATVDLRPQPAP